jgi:hypothetical protein
MGGAAALQLLVAVATKGGGGLLPVAAGFREGREREEEAAKPGTAGSLARVRFGTGASTVSTQVLLLRCAERALRALAVEVAASTSSE